MNRYDQEMENGDVESWLFSSSVVSFLSTVSGQYVGRKRSPIKPVRVHANMELQSRTQFFDSAGTWAIEWLPGHRQCHIRSASNQGYYWKFASELLVDAFPNSDETGPYIAGKDARYRPTTFYIAITGTSIAFQVINSKVWLSVNNKGEIVGSAEYADNSNFEVASKVSFSTSNLPGVTFTNSYMSSSLINNRLVVEPRLTEKRYMMMLFPKSDHFLLYSSYLLSYIFIDGDHLAIGVGEKQACHIRFKIVNGLWKIYVWVECEQKYIRAVVHERSIYIKTAVPGIALSKCKEASEFELVFQPINKVALTDSGQMYIQKSAVFGTPLEQLAERDGCDTPVVVEHLIRYITEHRLNEGLFRLSGSKTLQQQLIKQIDMGENPDDLFSPKVTPHFSESEACGLLKEFMRRSPLISNELKEQLMTIVSSPAGSENDNLISITFAGETLQYYQSIQTKLKIYLSRNFSRCAYALLKRLCVFFHNLGGYYESNKLTLANMVIVFLPCLTELPDMEPAWSNTFKILVADVSNVFM